MLNPEPIPTYAEANHTPTDLPPAYAVLDAAQTTFMIYGTFIHTRAGPAYQLSSPLDQRGPNFRIRRLHAKEVLQASHTPISFSRADTLYEITDPPLLDNQYHVHGKRRSCLPGVLEMKFKLNTWHIKHIPRVGAKPREIVTSKRVGVFGSTKLNRKREMEGSEWKDAQGRVVATEVLKVVDGGGGVVPTLELSADLDQTWRELLLSLWAARLWVAFGVEKTAALGGHYTDVRFAKYGGPAAMAGSAGFLGLAVGFSAS